VALTNYGTAMCAFEDAARYANQRVQFGEAIGRFQLIQEKFAQKKQRISFLALKRPFYVRYFTFLFWCFVEFL
ncbi:acyl-CoA dehydrogenase family protein, partial [Salmonella enterica subsp. enterica serovar Anatum]|nr:acyl-CoA dehydrogenase family protein [Salmonella enterica subsp. enterica serovar Anatum]